MCGGRGRENQFVQKGEVQLTQHLPNMLGDRYSQFLNQINQRKHLEIIASTVSSYLCGIIIFKLLNNLHISGEKLHFFSKIE